LAILEKEIWVGYNSTTVNYYEKMGYEFPKYFDQRDRLTYERDLKILVKTKDLPKNSTVKLTKICDECGIHVPNRTYRDINRYRNDGDGKDRCLKCSRVKGELTKKKNIKYERSLEFYSKTNNKVNLLLEFSAKNNKTPKEITFGTNDEYLWDCPKCNSEYDMSVSLRVLQNYNCPYCAGMRVNHTNCLWTTHPEFAMLLEIPYIGYEITHGSRKKEHFKCKECGNVQAKTVNDVIKKGYNCSSCSDGISYPEKIMISMLDQLKIKFEKEKIFNWSIKENNKYIRYDFYLPHLNLIIEMNGIQHYKESFKNLGGRSFEEEKENDDYKKRLAIDNGVNRYIIIDCKESKINYIKNNIIKSDLSFEFDLSKINWLQCHEFSCRTLVKTACDLWKNELKNTKWISEKLNISRNTVVKYLKQGSVLNWCDYDSNTEIMKHAKRQIVQLSLENKILKIWDSLTDASIYLKINKSSICGVSKGKQKTAGGYKWMYKADYEKYILEQNKLI
jgi:hypothetical protein